MSFITLHPEHGVNPMLTVCWWCGEDDGIALLGRNGGKKAPMRGIVNKAPCPKCKERIDQGCLYVFEAKAPDKYDPDQEPKRTGRMVCLTKEKGDEFRKDAPSVKHACFMEPDLYEKIFGHCEEKAPPK
jgi:hypothetical protein